MDKNKNDGTLFRDRAFSNIYVCVFDGENNNFSFDDNELSGLVKINAKETLNILKNEKGKLNATIIQSENNGIVEHEKQIEFNDFLVNYGETAISKYGDALRKVIELTSINN